MPTYDGRNKGWLFYLLTAFRFLTVFPLSAPEKTDQADFGRSTAFFPVVGLAQGIILLVMYKVFMPFLPSALVDALILVALVILWGGLHIDGFCDVIDGFGGGRDPARILNIMKDSSVGAFAVTGVALLFLMKYAGLTALPADNKAGIIVCMPVLSLWSMVLLARLHRYPREEGGTGRAFMENTGNKELITAGLITLGITLLFMRFHAFIIFMIISFVTLLMGEYSKSRIGGVTGDVLGATKEINDAMVLLLAAAFLAK